MLVGDVRRSRTRLDADPSAHHTFPDNDQTDRRPAPRAVRALARGSPFVVGRLRLDADATFERTMLERNHQLAVFAQGVTSVTLTDLVVRDTQSQPAGGTEGAR